MSDLSMERLEPAANTTAVQGQPSQRDAPAKARRRTAPRPGHPSEEPAENPEASSHKVDSLA